MPPRWMWPLDWEIKRHLEGVIARREAKMSGKHTDETEYGESMVSDDDIKAWIAENTQPEPV